MNTRDRRRQAAGVAVSREPISTLPNEGIEEPWQDLSRRGTPPTYAPAVK